MPALARRCNSLPIFLANLLLVEFEDVEPTGNRGLAVRNPHLLPNPAQLRNLKFMSGLVEHFGEIHISL